MNNATTTTISPIETIIAETPASELFTFWKNRFSGSDRFYLPQSIKDLLETRLPGTDVYLELRTSPDGRERAGWTQGFYDELSPAESLALNTKFGAWRASLQAEKAVANSETTEITVTFESRKGGLDSTHKVSVSAKNLGLMSKSLLGKFRPAGDNSFVVRSLNSLSETAVSEELALLS